MSKKETKKYILDEYALKEKDLEEVNNKLDIEKEKEDFIKTFNESMNRISEIFRKLAPATEIIEELRKEMKQSDNKNKKGKKGKVIRNWEKTKFYQK